VTIGGGKIKSTAVFVGSAGNWFHGSSAPMQKSSFAVDPQEVHGIPIFLGGGGRSKPQDSFFCNMTDTTHDYFRVVCNMAAQSDHIFLTTKFISAVRRSGLSRAGQLVTKWCKTETLRGVLMIKVVVPGCGTTSRYVPFIIASSINCIFFSSSSPSACSRTEMM